MLGGGGRRGRRRGRRAIDRSWRRTGEGTGGGEGGRGEARAHPELLERVRLPRGFPQQRREIDAVAFGLQVRQHARRLLHLLGRCEGEGAGGGCGGRVSRRARERFAKQTLGMIGATGPRSGRIPGGRRRATDRRAAPRRDLGPGAIAGRGRRRAPRGAPGSACPAGEKNKKASRSFFARVGDARLPTPSSTRAPRAGAPNPPPPCCVGVPYIACRIARAATIHRSGARCAVNDPATRILLQFQQSRPKAEKKRRYQIANRAADARHPGEENRAVQRRRKAPAPHLGGRDRTRALATHRLARARTP